MSPLLAYQINANGAEALARAAARLQIPIVHLSDLTSCLRRYALIVRGAEEDAPRPINVYGLKQLHGEQLRRCRDSNHAILADSLGLQPDSAKISREPCCRLAGIATMISVVSDQRGAP